MELLICDSDVKEEDIELAREKLSKEEEEVNIRLDLLLKRQCHIEAKLRGITKALPNLQIILSDSQQLSEMITFTSNLAENVSAKVRQLDITRLCAEGVKSALCSEDYEKAAVHVHRFLAMDQNLLRQTADIAEDSSNLTSSFTLLQEAASQLQAVVKQRFNEAVAAEDLASVERFFKLFPLLGLHDQGLEKFSKYLCTKISGTSGENLKTALNTQTSDKRANVIFADTLTLLFEGIARIIEIHQPLIETYYGPGRLMAVVMHLQRECDTQIHRILLEMNRQRHLQQISQEIIELLRNGNSRSSNTLGGGVSIERIEPRQIDSLLGELAIAHARFTLYYRFLRRRITADLEVGIPNEQKRNELLLELETSLAGTETCRQMQELLSTYLLLERYFMLESVHKAVAMDIVEEGSNVSSMVDDIFFILRKCIRRGASSGSLDGTCAVINNAAALLEEELCGALRTRLRQGYPSGYLDLTQAYNSVLAGRLQPTDSEQQRLLFLAALNNADSSIEYVETLVKQVSDEIPAVTATERSKLDSCLHGLSCTVSGMRSVVDFGIQQLRVSAVKPRVGPWVDVFLSVSHQLSEDEFVAYEAEQPFVQTLVRNLHGLLENFKETLTHGNYDTLVGILTEEVTSHLEKSVLKSSFNRLGGLAFDKEVRALASFLTSATSWSVRDKFARLTQMATILNLEKPMEIADYWGNSSSTLTWRLTPAEIRQIMTLRVDFRSEDIKRLKL